MTQPRIAPTRPEHPGLDDDHPPDLRPGHPGGAQDADLADPLVHVHRQRVHDAEGGHDDRHERQRVEQPEDPGEGRVDRPGDPVDRVRLEGVAAGDGRQAGPVRRPSRPGSNRIAKASAPLTPKPPVASGQPTRTDSPDRPGIDRSTIPTTRRPDLRPAPTGKAISSPTRSPSVRRKAVRDDRRAALVEGVEGGGPVAADEA